MSARGEVPVAIEGRTLTLSNLDKVLYPAANFTKGDVIDYCVQAAPALLAHLRGRPLTLKRYPEGAQGPSFYEKRCPPHRPSWVRTAAVYSQHRQGNIDFCVADDLPTLVFVANLAALELHPYLHRAPELERPTALVLDLDPGPPANVLQCCEVALLLRSLLEALGLMAFPKTSGSKGMQLYVPLNVAVSYPETKTFARALASGLASRRPDLVLSSMSRSLRTGRVFIDWSQNDPHKTTICAYSLRARERPTVSTPLRWEELERALDARDPGRLAFEASATLERLQRHGDLFGPVETMEQKLPPPAALEPAWRGMGMLRARGAGGSHGRTRRPGDSGARDERPETAPGAHHP